MASGHHICVPLLSLAQQSSSRAILVDDPEDVGDANRLHFTASSTGVQLLRRVALLSRALSTCLTISPGSVVILVAHSSTAAMEAMLAVLDAGCVLCPVNWRWTALELSQALQRLSPALVLFDPACSELATKAVQLAFLAEEVPEPATSAVRRPAAAHLASKPHVCLIDHGGPSGGSCSSQPESHDKNTSRQSSSCAASCFEAMRAVQQEVKEGAHAAITTTEAGSLTPNTSPSRTAFNTSVGTATLLTLVSDPTHGAPQQQPSTRLPQPQPEPIPMPQLQLLSSPCGTALLVFTSGTTAAPKAVRLSHAAVHAQSLVKLALVDYCSSDTYLHLAPLFHIGGLSSAFAALMAGCKQVFLSRFESHSALRAITRHAVSAFIAVPTMLQDLSAAAAASALPPPGNPKRLLPLQLPTGKSGDVRVSTSGIAESHGLASVRRILVGAGGTAPNLQDAVSRTFPCAELISAYGMTEACSSMTFRHLRSAVIGPPSATQWWAGPASDAGERPSVGSGADVAVCVGWPAPGVQIFIRRSVAGAGGIELPNIGRSAGGIALGTRGSSSSGAVGAGGLGCEPYMVGEVLTRGPHVMLGYWQDPDATAEVLSPDGWLRTGDLGYLAADGALWLMGRAKDMIKSAGENVFAPQVEAVLCSHPAVASAAVVGLPDKRLGEQVAALVVLRDGWSFDGPFFPTPTTAEDAAAARPQGAAGGGGGALPTTSLADLQAHCRSQGLASFRLPRFAAAQREPLPTNSSGKVQKLAVRERLAVLRGSAEIAVIQSRL